jgi:hypothetical protein
MVIGDKAMNSRQGFHKNLSHLMPREVPCHEHKCPYSSLHQCGALMGAMPDPFILGENNPALTSNLA